MAVCTDCVPTMWYCSWLGRDMLCEGVNHAYGGCWDMTMRVAIWQLNERTILCRSVSHARWARWRAQREGQGGLTHNRCVSAMQRVAGTRGGLRMWLCWALIHMAEKAHLWRRGSILPNGGVCSMCIVTRACMTTMCARHFISIETHIRYHGGPGLRPPAMARHCCE